MGQTIFITGGARSGKSRFAEQLAAGYGAPLGYLATAQPLDQEMEQRIRIHQQLRGEGWGTVEEALHLSQALTLNDGRFNMILVDCLTLWLSNLLLLDDEPREESETRVMDAVQLLATTLRNMTTPVIIVTNEVGMGIVPENRLARMFRDIAGQANQIIAAAAGEAWLVASGIPLKLK